LFLSYDILGHLISRLIIIIIIIIIIIVIIIVSKQPHGSSESQYLDVIVGTLLSVLVTLKYCAVKATLIDCVIGCVFFN